MSIVNEYCVKSIIANLDILAANNHKPYNKATANKYFQSTCVDRLNGILNEVRSDGKKGDIFGSLEIGRIDPLARVSAEVSLKHGLLKYAEEIYNNSIE